MTALIYVCDHVVDGRECGKAFGTPRQLGIHKASHDREKVKCPRCGRSVTYLETHMRRVHSHDPVKVLATVEDLLAEVVTLREENERLRSLVGK